MDQEARFFFESWLKASLQALEALTVIFRGAFISLQIPKVKLKEARRWAEQLQKPGRAKHTIKPEMADLSKITPKLERDYFKDTRERGEAVFPVLTFPAAEIDRTFKALRDCRELSEYLGAVHRHVSAFHSPGPCSDKNCFLSRPIPSEWVRSIVNSIGELSAEAERAGVPGKFQEADQIAKARLFSEHQRKRKTKMTKKANAEEWRDILRRELEERAKGPYWKMLSKTNQAKRLQEAFAKDHGLKVKWETIRKEI